MAPKIGLRTALAEIGRSLGNVELDGELDLKRDLRPVKSARFE